MQQEIMLSGDAILELIPQRAPMVMVDGFFGIDGGSSFTGLKIQNSNIFCKDGFLQEYGLIEHIAQSAAVRVGYIYHSRNEEIPVGFIGSVDKMTIHVLPSVGDELRTELRIEQEVGEITLVSAMVYCREQLMAEGRMKIFLNKGNK